MNHALQSDRQFARGRGGADGKRGEELSWRLHETFQNMVLPFRAMQRPRQVGRSREMPAKPDFRRFR